MRISWPSAIAASTVHDFTGSPSISTTQAPQLDVSQPQWVPVRPSVVAQEVHEQQSRLDVARVLLAVDGHRDLHQSPPLAVPGAVGARAARGGSAPGQVALVVGRPALVGGRVAVLGGERRRPARTPPRTARWPTSAASARGRRDARRADRGQPDRRRRRSCRRRARPPRPRRRPPSRRARRSTFS